MNSRERWQVAATLLCAVTGLALLCGAGEGAATQPGPRELAHMGLRSAAVIGAIALLGAAFSGPQLARALLAQPSARPLGLLGTLGAVVGTLSLSQLLDVAVRLSGTRPGSRLEMIDEAVAAASTPHDALWLLSGLVVATALAEELLFRGLVLQAIAKLWGLGVALVSSSLLFGAVHMDLAQGSAAAVLGLYLGLVVAASGSVRPAILCHLANNFVALLGSASIQGPDLAALLSPPLGVDVVLFVAGSLAWCRMLPSALPAWRHAPAPAEGDRR